MYIYMCRYLCILFAKAQTVCINMDEIFMIIHAPSPITDNLKASCKI